jgi:deoxyribodipyrimidine photolyase-related protein
VAQALATYLGAGGVLQRSLSTRLANDPIMKPTLRLILGDQLNIEHSWFTKPAREAVFLMMEAREEATYAKHHIQKIVAFFAAMREFAAELQRRGFEVIYRALDDKGNLHSLSGNIEQLVQSGAYGAFEYQLPDEYRVDQALSSLASRLSVPTRVVDTEHFLTEREALPRMFPGRKRYVMEYFYREVRKRYDILLEDGEPIGGKWNYDAENRNRLPDSVVPPAPLTFGRDVSEIVEMLDREGVPALGTLNPTNFSWPVTRQEALQALEYFCIHCLLHFGTYQDAMHTEHRFLFHSRLSFSMNVKLLSPLEIVHRAIMEWQKRQNEITISQIEGFVRQIAGWREFMRAIYWSHMPEYKELNFFEHTRPLPGYFWNAKTKMNCVKHAVQQSLEDAYAHHIQRLMVTGNFTLLAGIDPAQVDEWYLGIYADALEWVQLPNTHGMSQFADGGIVATKPYVSGGNYISKMSNYCSGCYYNQKIRTGEKACPFNSLYWDFMRRNRARLEKNPRIGMAYRTFDKLTPSDKAAIEKQAAHYLKNIEEL